MIAGLKGAKGAVADHGELGEEHHPCSSAWGRALSLEEAAKGALDLRGQFKRLAFDVKAGVGEVVDLARADEARAGPGDQVGDRHRGPREAFKIVRDETGDLALAKDSLVVDRVTRARDRRVGRVARHHCGQAEREVQRDGEDMPEALAAVFSLSKQGGIQFDEMAARSIAPAPRRS
jgi:hypothetical protein